LSKAALEDSRRIAQDIFDRVVANEPWAGRITIEIDDEWLCPHLAYADVSRRGRVRMPPHDDPLVLAGWIAHEVGHFEDFQYRRPSRTMGRIEQVIRSERVHPIIQAVVRKLYYLIFWRERMRREIYAHRAEIRFLKKAEFSLDATIRSDEASDKIAPPMPYSGFVEKLFSTRMIRAQEAITRKERESSR
jgi:hypothetical protein